MKRALIQSWILGLGMVSAAGLAHVVTPTVKLADGRPPIVLDKEIPTHFGEWQEDPNQMAAVVNPTAAAEIKRIYAQTLSRTYVNHSGERIMLSIAYGTDQSDNLSIHFPEGCYVGQGFAIGATDHVQLKTNFGAVPVSRLVATLNSRNEPITYWVVVGERAVDSSWGMKKVKLSYAMKGLIPDATLMRVSTITPNVEDAYALQTAFVNELLAAMPRATREHFAGLALQ